MDKTGRSNVADTRTLRIRIRNRRRLVGIKDDILG